MILESPLHNFRSNDNGQAGSEQQLIKDSNDSIPFKHFTQVLCFEKFESFKEKRMKILNEEGKFVIFIINLGCYTIYPRRK